MGVSSFHFWWSGLETAVHGSLVHSSHEAFGIEFQHVEWVHPAQNKLQQ
jgi:hypothetical protein